MKNVTSFRIGIVLIAMGMWASATLNAQTVIADSATMGPGYANDVYYSLETGTVATPPAGSYDIAFYTNMMSAGIATNDGRGVTLWAYPKSDTSGWAAIDTSGLSTWIPLYNSIESWEEGAFNRNSKNHPDYGWGIYNTITHDVEGDSLFIIKTRSGLFKKLWIISKVSTANTYHFRFADLDGANLQVASVNCMPYVTKNFVAYDLETNQLVDREPAKDAWDLLFTKYMGLYGGTTPYAVTGVLNNLGSSANRFYPVTPGYTDWSAAPFSENREVIGWDWKTFDMGTFSYIIADSLIFFDSTRVGNIQKLWFTGFSGSASGKFYFNKQVISGTGIGTLQQLSLNFRPNPATDNITLELPSAGLLTITDLTGKQLIVRRVSSTGLIQLSVDNLPAGIYLVQFANERQVMSNRLLVQ